MLAVIFEVLLAEDKQEEYLNIAAMLRQHLKNVDGFIAIERFKSLSEKEKIFSLSYWMMIQQTKLEKFESSQIALEKKRSEYVADCRLRV